MGELLTFYLLAGLLTILSVAVVTIKNPISAVILLVFNLFVLAGIYALQKADFIAAIQVIIYAGAILVLFMFVIMLLNLDPRSLTNKKKSSSIYFFGFFIALGFLFFMYKIIGNKPHTTQFYDSPARDNTYEVGIKLFSEYLWPFELASILILLAIIASIVITRKPNSSHLNKR